MGDDDGEPCFGRAIVGRATLSHKRSPFGFSKHGSPLVATGTANTTWYDVGASIPYGYGPSQHVEVADEKQVQEGREQRGLRSICIRAKVMARIRVASSCMPVS